MVILLLLGGASGARAAGPDPYPGLSPEEILGFDRIFVELLVESYRWDLWAVAYIVNGGASDDSFEYFRYWIISQGQKYYEAALENPEKAADAASSNQENECEDIRYVAGMAYEEKTGEEIPQSVTSAYPAYPSEPIGTPWTEDDLESLYPKLSKKFG
ncbi:MAG: DUF4240 domain-containing protein [Proteobacteria bacterium]|nr:MAG: DUF4240 domain-containing protein [Pseudomonadota bacterium]